MNEKVREIINERANRKRHHFLTLETMGMWSEGSNSPAVSVFKVKQQQLQLGISTRDRLMSAGWSWIMSQSSAPPGRVGMDCLPKPNGNPLLVNRQH